jgi:hypothetical protein
MNFEGSCAAHVLAALVAASSAWAQEPATDVPNKRDTGNQRVIVKVADTRREVRGRLLRLDSETLSLRTDHAPVHLPLDRVLRIDVIERDSLVNGAIFGAIYVAACARWWCRQGTSGPSHIPRDILLGAGAGALAGAGIDALRNKRRTIFEAGGSTAPRPSGVGASFRLRF